MPRTASWSETTYGPSSTASERQQTQSEPQGRRKWDRASVPEIQRGSIWPSVLIGKFSTLEEQLDRRVMRKSEERRGLPDLLFAPRNHIRRPRCRPMSWNVWTLADPAV
ncbi:hypothetical protein SRHO_G00336350 [Serrasalmus rhombeus]